MQNFKNKVKSKYSLYFLCFLALNYIEFIRSTQAGIIWQPVANCTGLVMMVIIFSAYPLRDFLSVKNYIYSALCLAAMAVIYVHWTSHIGDYLLWQAETAVMNIWWLGIMLPYLFNKVFVKKEIQIHLGVAGILWFALTAWTVVSIANKIWPLWYFLMFGAFYLTKYSQADKENLFNGMIDGTIFSFFIIQGWAFLFRPFDMFGYYGAFANNNMMALYYVIIYCMVLFKLYLLHQNNAKIGWKLFYFMGAGALLSFQLLTICKTAWVTSFCVTLLYGYIVLKKIWRVRFRKIILQGCGLLLCVCLTFPLVFCSARYLPTIHPHPVWHEGEWAEWRVQSWDPYDSEKYIDLEEVLGGIFGELGNILMIYRKLPFAMVVHAKSNAAVYDIPPEKWGMGSITARKYIGKAFLENSTWLGWKDDGSQIKFYMWDMEMPIWHSQNLWIQVTFRFGYPAGILLMLLTLVIVIKNWKASGNYTSNVYAVMPIIMCAAFFLFGTMEVVWNIGQLILFLMFFVQHPQFIEKMDRN